MPSRSVRRFVQRFPNIQLKLEGSRPCENLLPSLPLPVRQHRGRFFSAKIIYLPKMIEPFPNDLVAVGLDDAKEIAQDRSGDPGVVAAEQGLPAAGDPYLCPVCGRPALRNVDVHRLERVVFVGSEVYDIWPDSKNLRHEAPRLSGRTQ